MQTPEEAQAEITRLNGLLTNATSEVQRLQGESATLTTSRTALQTDLETARGQLATSERRVRTLETDAFNERENRRTLESQLTTAQQGALSEGQVAASQADLDELAAFRQLGTADTLGTQVREAQDALLREAGYPPNLLRRLAGPDVITATREAEGVALTIGGQPADAWATAAGLEAELAAVRTATTATTATPPAPSTQIPVAGQQGGQSGTPPDTWGQGANTRFGVKN